MALCGSIECFKHAISTNLYEFSDYIAEHAVLGGNYEIIHILEQKGISFNDVIALAPVCRPEIFDWLLNHYETGDKIDACAKFINEGMWLYALALLKKEDVSRALTVLPHDGGILLGIASRAGAFLVVKHLVAIDKANKSKIKKDEPNSTALCYASGGGHFSIVKYLIKEYHCDPEAKDNDGKTALDLAYENINIQI